MERPLFPPDHSAVVLENKVLELPGLYGPFTFPEKLFQKIWLKGTFDDRDLVSTCGRKLNIVQRGKWNLLGGPDFKQARIKFDDGQDIVGDIELHLDAQDWASHRHAFDPAYDRVMLHVVLFAPPLDHVTTGGDGKRIPVLVLLPLLRYDLEDFAAEDAIERLANRPAAHIVESLGTLAQEELSALLNRKAAERWYQKVRYAQIRVQKLGWTEACHHMALEVLGYRFNRAAMLRVAACVPLGAWNVKPADAGELIAHGGDWSFHGIRPANNPRIRLRQYSEWVSVYPRWPERLIELGQELPSLERAEKGSLLWSRGKLKGVRQVWCEQITADVISGTRFDNLVCDCFLPYLASGGIGSLERLWFEWNPGDVPRLWCQALKQLNVFGGRGRPLCHGMIQGLLGWLIEREHAAALSAGRSA